MSKMHTVTLHHVITVYNDMFNLMDGVMQALVKKETQWNEDLYFAMKVARQKLSKHHAEVTRMTGLLLMSVRIHDPFLKLQSFRLWDKAVDIQPENEMSYTTQNPEAFQNYVENEYRAKHR